MLAVFFLIALLSNSAYALYGSAIASQVDVLPGGSANLSFTIGGIASSQCNGNGNPEMIIAYEPTGSGAGGSCAWTAQDANGQGSQNSPDCANWNLQPSSYTTSPEYCHTFYGCNQQSDGTWTCTFSNYQTSPNFFQGSYQYCAYLDCPAYGSDLTHRYPIQQALANITINVTNSAPNTTGPDNLVALSVNPTVVAPNGTVDIQMTQDYGGSTCITQNFPAGCVYGGNPLFCLTGIGAVTCALSGCQYYTNPYECGLFGAGVCSWYNGGFKTSCNYIYTEVAQHGPSNGQSCLNPQGNSQVSPPPTCGSALSSSVSATACMAAQSTGGCTDGTPCPTVNYQGTAPPDVSNYLICGYESLPMAQAFGQNYPGGEPIFATSILQVCSGPNCPTPSCNICASEYTPAACFNPSVSTTGLCEAATNPSTGASISDTPGCVSAYGSGYVYCQTSSSGGTGPWGGPNPCPPGALPCTGLSPPSVSLSPVTNAICSVYTVVNTVLFILALVIMLIGGTLYAGSHILPGQSRGVVQGYAMGMVLGGLIASVIAVVAPWVLSIATNVPISSILSACS